MKTEEMLNEDDITQAFDSWADDNCNLNGFYTCKHPDNKSKNCFQWECPKIEEFYKSRYYTDLLQKDETIKVAWFSAGATSAVACKLALQQYNNVEICYIETGSHHPDSLRFLKDCEKWFGKKINILKSRYKDHFEVFEKTGILSMPDYTPCTTMLKVRVRQEFESKHPEITHYIWGFEAGTKEENRAKKMVQRYPEYKHLFPLIENKLNKASCLALLQEAGVAIPAMYKKGYHNNNCIGCVRGGAGYWNKIRQDFPEAFERMAKIERKIGHSVLKKYFLDELPKDAGREEKEILPACSIFCGFINLESEGNNANN